METFTVPDSTNVRTFTYNDDGSMTVVFANGRTYRYANVPYDLYLSLQSAAYNGQSVGSLFRGLIVVGGFEFEEVTS